jgi:hypothetical protein
LQRAVVDFGAEQAFAQVPKRLQEHYGVSLPVSAVRQITLLHAQSMAPTLVGLEQDLGTEPGEAPRGFAASNV